MQLKDRVDIYKNEYYFQVDFKEKIYTRITLYAVLVTACITGNFSIFKDLCDFLPKLTLLICNVWILEIGLLVFILYGLYSISHIKEDLWVNTAVNMENYRNTLKQHFNQHATTPTPAEEDEYLEDNFSIYLIGQYSTCSSVIRENNIYRQKWLGKIILSTYALLLLTGILGIITLLPKIH